MQKFVPHALTKSRRSLSAERRPTTARVAVVVVGIAVVGIVVVGVAVIGCDAGTAVVDSGSVDVEGAGMVEVTGRAVVAVALIGAATGAVRGPVTAASAVIAISRTPSSPRRNDPRGDALPTTRPTTHQSADSRAQ